MLCDGKQLLFGQAAQPDAIFKRNHIRYRCGPPDKPQGLGRSIVSELLTFLSLGLEAAPKSPRPRRCRLGKISRNIDPPPAGQDDVARDHAQFPPSPPLPSTTYLAPTGNRRGKRLDR